MWNSVTAEMLSSLLSACMSWIRWPFSSSWSPAMDTTLGPSCASSWRSLCSTVGLTGISRLQEAGSQPHVQPKGLQHPCRATPWWIPSWRSWIFPTCCCTHRAEAAQYGSGAGGSRYLWAPGLQPSHAALSQDRGHSCGDAPLTPKEEDPPQPYKRLCQEWHLQGSSCYRMKTSKQTNNYNMKSHSCSNF